VRTGVESPTITPEKAIVLNKTRAMRITGVFILKNYYLIKKDLQTKTGEP
jgi:hypothetical protein